MLINSSEYEKMYQTEEKLWWYKILHEKVLEVIILFFQENKSIKILDAGCGTGGMLEILKKNDYINIQGFDFSEDAVKFCKERCLDVKLFNILNFDSEFKNEHFDLIINNDVLYQFSNSDIKIVLENFERKLKPNGIIISNNQAFKLFSGTHDIAVGAKQRFQISDFEKIVHNSELKIRNFTYWSFFLSPLILTIRFLQRFRLKLNLIDLKKIKSDVELPSDFMNNLFYKIVKFEETILKKSPFGSSLFIVFQKKS